MAFQARKSISNRISNPYRNMYKTHTLVIEKRPFKLKLHFSYLQIRIAKTIIRFQYAFRYVSVLSGFGFICHFTVHFNVIISIGFYSSCNARSCVCVCEHECLCTDECKRWTRYYMKGVKHTTKSKCICRIVLICKKRKKRRRNKEKMIPFFSNWPIWINVESNERSRTERKIKSAPTTNRMRKKRIENKTKKRRRERERKIIL